MAKKGRTVKHYRRADTGEYVSEKYAKEHPRTTVKETDEMKPRKKK